jgi:transposase
LTPGSAVGRRVVSVSSVIRRDAQRRVTGSFEPKPQGGDTRSRRIAARHAAVMAAFEEARDRSLEEVRARLAERGVAASGSALSRFFQRHGMRRKKDRTCGRAGPRARRERAPRLVRRAARSRSREARLPRRRGGQAIDPVDRLSAEGGPRRTWRAGTGAAAGATGCAWASLMATGRPRRSSRASASAAWPPRSPVCLNQWRINGSLLEGPINGEGFEAHLAQVLAPILRPVRQCRSELPGVRHWSEHHGRRRANGSPS